MIEFLEALLPFSSKLTQEARDLLCGELDKVLGERWIMRIECYIIRRRIARNLGNSDNETRFE